MLNFTKELDCVWSSKEHRDLPTNLGSKYLFWGGRISTTSNAAGNQVTYYISQVDWHFYLQLNTKQKEKQKLMHSKGISLVISTQRNTLQCIYTFFVKMHLITHFLWVPAGLSDSVISTSKSIWHSNTQKPLSELPYFKSLEEMTAFLERVTQIAFSDLFIRANFAYILIR